MNAYLDSSVLLRILLNQPDPLREFSRYGQIIAGSLVEVECLRTLDRMRVTGEMTEEQNASFRNAFYQTVEAMEIIQPSPVILRRASGPFPVALGTLDAIHLSTAIAWRDETGEELTVATHDKSLARAAHALGFKIEGT